MAIIEVKVPQLSESVAEATLLQWKKQPGEAVAIDEILIEVETDKVVLEVPAPAAGVLVAHVVADGATVVADQVIATDRHRRQGQLQPHPRRRCARADRRRRRSARCRRGGVAMPAAAKLMADKQLARRFGGRHRQGWPRDQGRRARRGGGAKGRAAGGCRHRQWPSRCRAVAAPVAPNLGERPEQRVPMSRLRARVAERLLQSQATNAILTTFNEVNMAPVMEMRKKFQEKFEKEHGVQARLHELLRQGRGRRAEEVPGAQRPRRRQRHRLPRLLRHRHRRRLAARPGGADRAQRRPDELRRHREEDRRVRQEGRRRQARHRRADRRHVLDLQRRRVRLDAQHADHQPAAERHPRRACDQGPRRGRERRRSSCAR